MKLSSLALAASLAFASVAAQAATRSYSNPFGSSPVPFSETLTLPKFNSSFGTLIGAKLTLAFDIVASVEVINLGDSAASFDSASAAFSISATSNGIDATSVAATATANSSSGGNVNSGVGTKFIQGGLTASGSSIQTVGPSGLPSYIGGGSDSITFALSALEGTYNGVGSNVGFGGSGSAAGTLSVTYDYTPTSPIPEPSTAVLMGLGMLAIGASLRRRRSEG
jgi:hypothetical protein